MFHLVTSYYSSTNSKRQDELNLCLTKNLNNNCIEKIYLLNDTVYELSFLPELKKNKKIVQIVVDDENKNRLGFDYAIKFINENLGGKKCILANSDIYFDDTLIKFRNHNLHNVFCALSRYDNNILHDACDVNKCSISQDSWIFVSPLRLNINKCNFKFGHPGCDNRIAYLAMKAKYKVINPSKTIKTHHVHRSRFRTYNEDFRVEKPYYFIEFTTL